MLALGKLCNSCCHLLRYLYLHQSRFCSSWLHSFSSSPDHFSGNFQALLLFSFSICSWDCKRLSRLHAYCGPGFPGAIHPLPFHGGGGSLARLLPQSSRQADSTSPWTLGFLRMCPSLEFCLRRGGHGHFLHRPDSKGSSASFGGGDDDKNSVPDHIFFQILQVDCAFE